MCGCSGSGVPSGMCGCCPPCSGHVLPPLLWSPVAPLALVTCCPPPCSGHLLPPLMDHLPTCSGHLLPPLLWLMFPKAGVRLGTRPTYVVFAGQGAVGDPPSSQTCLEFRRMRSGHMFHVWPTARTLFGQTQRVALHVAGMAAGRATVWQQNYSASSNKFKAICFEFG